MSAYEMAYGVVVVALLGFAGRAWRRAREGRRPVDLVAGGEPWRWPEPQQEGLTLLDTSSESRLMLPAPQASSGVQALGLVGGVSIVLATLGAVATQFGRPADEQWVVLPLGLGLSFGLAVLALDATLIRIDLTPDWVVLHVQQGVIFSRQIRLRRRALKVKGAHHPLRMQRVGDKKRAWLQYTFDVQGLVLSRRFYCHCGEMAGAWIVSHLKP